MTSPTHWPPPPLKELRIKRCDFTAKDLADALQRVGTHLESLEFHSTMAQANMDEVLQSLVARRSDDRDADPRSIKPMELPCPMLRRIAFTDVSLVPGTAIKEFVRARLPRPAHGGSTPSVHIACPRAMHSITIERCPGVDPDTIRWLKTAVTDVRYVRDRRR